jgi:hypothetical protein
MTAAIMDDAKTDAQVPQGTTKGATRTPRSTSAGPKPKAAKGASGRHPEVAARPGRAPAPEPASPGPSPPSPPPASSPATKLELLNDDIRRANEGDQAACARLREFLDNNPEIWQSVGDASAHAELSRIRAMSDGNVLLEMSIRRRMKHFKAEHAGATPTAMEKLLVGMIAVRTLAVEHAEILAAEQISNIKVAQFRECRADSAQKRLASSIKLLCLVRSQLPKSTD